MILGNRIRKYERGLLFRRGDFARVLSPGKHRFISRLWAWRRDRVEVVSTLSPRFKHALLDALVKEEALRAELEVIDLADSERAIVWRAGRVIDVLSPGVHAFWRDPTLRIERFEVTSEPFEHERIEAIMRHASASDKLQVIDVEPHGVAMLIVNAKLERKLDAGRYVFWKGSGNIRVRVVDLRERTHDVGGQEILTSDKVTLRLNLVVAYRVVDVMRAIETTLDFEQALYREAQLALRAAVGTRTLDALLADKEGVGGEIRNGLRERAEAFGVEVRSVGLRDIILPGEMKTILNQVIEAEKRAQADLIRRREETSAARSQANTAKLLEQSPTLARMRELELLGEILKGTKSTFVFGKGDLAEQVRSLVTQDD